MVEVKWTDQARIELAEIGEFISRDSERYAKIVVSALIESTERLRRFPNSGRMVPEIGSRNIREVIWGNYRVIYRVFPTRVQVLTIHHAARSFDES